MRKKRMRLERGQYRRMKRRLFKQITDRSKFKKITDKNKIEKKEKTTSNTLYNVR